MDPVFRLYSLVNRFINNELPLEEFEREFVPLLPHFAQARRSDAPARLALTVDEMLVDIGLAQATEDELRAVLASSPASSPTIIMTIGEPKLIEAGSAEAVTTHLVATSPVLTKVEAVGVGSGSTTARTQLEGAIV